MSVTSRSSPPLWRRRRTFWRQFTKILSQQSSSLSRPGYAPMSRDICTDMSSGMHVRQDAGWYAPMSRNINAPTSIAAANTSYWWCVDAQSNHGRVVHSVCTDMTAPHATTSQPGMQPHHGMCTNIVLDQRPAEVGGMKKPFRGDGWGGRELEGNAIATAGCGAQKWEPRVLGREGVTRLLFIRTFLLLPP